MSARRKLVFKNFRASIFLKFNGSHPLVFQYRRMFIYVYNTTRVV